MYKKSGERTNFNLKKSNVMDDLKVIDLYNDATLSGVPASARTGHWVQEYYRLTDILNYIDSQLQDIKKVTKICQAMTP